MQIDDLDILASEISRYSNENALNIQGPVEIEYGFGWEPTITFWSGLRRVHFYFDIETYKEGVTVEVSEFKPNQKIKRPNNVDTNSEVMRGIITTSDEAWAIVEKFLSQEHTFENLPNHGWKTDSSDHDKFIPHPPNAPNAGNIASMVEVMKQVGEPWHPPQLQKNQSWLQRLRDWFS
jgi:hypothetical protein